MKPEVRVPAALLALVLLHPATGLSQDQDGPKKSDSMVNVTVSISAEGKPALPANSKIQWEGVGEECKTVTGSQALYPTKPTPLRLQVCKVKLMIFITGFDTQSVAVDLAGNEDKYADPIRITVKHSGAAEIDWSHPPAKAPVVNVDNARPATRER